MSGVTAADALNAAIAPNALAGAVAEPPMDRPVGSPLDSGQGSWLRDFRLSNGGLRVTTTGAQLKLTPTLAVEALIWLKFYAWVRIRSWGLALSGARGPRIWFAPQRPRPWYLIWSALAWSGGRIARSPAEADAAFVFEDATWSTQRAIAAIPSFNAGCPDVSKSAVARVFEEVFGYPLAIDPDHWRGLAVEKSEINGVHDGSIVDCPRPRREGMHYQRLIDTSDGRFSHDLRTPCVGGKPVFVCVKRKPEEARFSIHNHDVTLRSSQEVYSPLELDLIGRFLAAMGLDWAGLDILRDRYDGRIYVVDVNKTDVGPIIALPWRDKLRSTALLAAALQSLVAGAQPET